MRHGDQKKIAAILGVSTEHVCKYFNRQRNFSIRLSRIAAARFPEVPLVLWLQRDIETIKNIICIPSDMPEPTE